MVVTLAGLVVVLGAAPVLARAGDDASSLASMTEVAAPRCDVPRAPTPQGDPSDAVVPAVESPTDDLVRSVGKDRGPVEIVTTLPLSEPMPEGVEHLNVAVGQFQRADGRALESEQVVAEAKINQSGRRQSVRLWVCIDPVVVDRSGPRLVEAHAGSYTGTVVIDDPRVTDGVATYTLNMKFGNDALVFAVVGVGLLVGAGGGVALATGLSVELLRRKEALVRAATAVAASIAAAYTVLSAQYLSDPSWQGDLPLFIALFATTVGAVYAAANFAGSVDIRRSTLALDATTPAARPSPDADAGASLAPSATGTPATNGHHVA
jgi:hypothetical protein